jgi:hypothetical protein
MNSRTTEILNLLEAIENEYGLQLEKHKKGLIREAINIITSKSLEPVEDEKKFDVPQALIDAKGRCPSVGHEIHQKPLA